MTIPANPEVHWVWKCQQAAADILARSSTPVPMSLRQFWSETPKCTPRIFGKFHRKDSLLFPTPKNKISVQSSSTSFVINRRMLARFKINKQISKWGIRDYATGSKYKSSPSPVTLGYYIHIAPQCYCLVLSHFELKICPSPPVHSLLGHTLSSLLLVLKFYFSFGKIFLL